MSWTISDLGVVIQKVMPECERPSQWALSLFPAMERFEISRSADRIDDFLAQIAVESKEMNRVSENLNYTALRLTQVWPKRFPTIQAAEPYAINPVGLANYAYGGRLGNTAPGDGWLYRGRGLIQITGKKNYAEMQDLIGLPILTNPDLLLQPAGAALSACAYWKRHGLNELAENRPGDDVEADFATITKAIQGGAEGIEKRRMYLGRARVALNLKEAA